MVNDTIWRFLFWELISCVKPYDNGGFIDSIREIGYTGYEVKLVNIKQIQEGVSMLLTLSLSPIMCHFILLVGISALIKMVHFAYNMDNITKGN